MESQIKKNAIVGFGGQIIVLLLGIIVPRIILVNYGSDVNGLLSTITQIFTYMALLEAGIGQAARNALFKPIASGDKNGISQIVSLSKYSFRKITYVYGSCVIFLSFILPFVLKSNVDYFTIFFTVFFQGMSGVVTFNFLQTEISLLNSDGKGYINTTVNLINQIVSYSARIILAFIGINIAVIQFAYFIITIAKVVFYHFYMRKQYPWIRYKKPPKNKKLKDRNSYVVTEIAWTIFSSTDLIILSTFVSTQISSVYSVYNMVFTSINLLLNSIYSSISYVLGQQYNKDIVQYQRTHDIFLSVFVGGITILISVTYILVIPFIKFYTSGVEDISYIDTKLPLMFCLIQLLSWSRYVTGNLTGVAGYAKPTSVISMIEAVVNLSLSLILVKWYGIYGVLFATVIALPIKVIFCAYISDYKVLKRSCKKTLKIYVCNYFLFFSVVIISNLFKIQIKNFFEFCFWGIILTFGIGLAGGTINCIANTNLFILLRRLIRKNE